MIVDRLVSLLAGVLLLIPVSAACQDAAPVTWQALAESPEETREALENFPSGGKLTPCEDLSVDPEHRAFFEIAAKPNFVCWYRDRFDTFVDGTPDPRAKAKQPYRIRNAVYEDGKPVFMQLVFRLDPKSEGISKIEDIPEMLGLSGLGAPELLSRTTAPRPLWRDIEGAPGDLYRLEVVMQRGREGKVRVARLYLRRDSAMAKAVDRDAVAVNSSWVLPETLSSSRTPDPDLTVELGHDRVDVEGVPTFSRAEFARRPSQEKPLPARARRVVSERQKQRKKQADMLGMPFDTHVRYFATRDWPARDVLAMVAAMRETEPGAEHHLMTRTADLRVDVGENGDRLRNPVWPLRVDPRSVLLRPYDGGEPSLDGEAPAAIVTLHDDGHIGVQRFAFVDERPTFVDVEAVDGCKKATICPANKVDTVAQLKRGRGLDRELRALAGPKAEQADETYDALLSAYDWEALASVVGKVRDRDPIRIGSHDYRYDRRPVALGVAGQTPVVVLLRGRDTILGDPAARRGGDLLVRLPGADR